MLPCPYKYPWHCSILRVGDLLIWVKVDVSIPLGTSRRRGNRNHNGSPFGGLGRNSVSEGISERSRSADPPNDPRPRPIGTQQPFLLSLHRHHSSFSLSSGKPKDFTWSSLKRKYFKR
ncbi:hypothetical protein CDAR_242031 [Caerostris darwini]|uniref:Uncharacterized protein n=1 Tax=Caerostris darwini TaxID=1538125 RepID=A0AAV4NND0_9ARAC|nr:hypothetical protein CDAR_242031 [Caerostris darwini]